MERLPRWPYPSLYRAITALRLEEENLTEENRSCIGAAYRHPHLFKNRDLSRLRRLWRAYLRRHLDQRGDR